MYPKILYFLIPAVLLFAAILIVVFWEKIRIGSKSHEPANTGSEGAFRAFYHSLWILIFWSGIALSMPLWISYKSKLAELSVDLRWVVIGKVIVFPLIVLFLLWYGGKQGYLKWINSLEWPDKENE